jgi:hypothetical protein
VCAIISSYVVKESMMLNRPAIYNCRIRDSFKTTEFG